MAMQTDNGEPAAGNRIPNPIIQCNVSMDDHFNHWRTSKKISYCYVREKGVASSLERNGYRMMSLGLSMICTGHGNPYDFLGEPFEAGICKSSGHCGYSMRRTASDGT